MELWQIDVMACVFLTNDIGISVGHRHRRPLPLLCHRQGRRRATARPVRDALQGALNIYGIPEHVLTDNCKVFTDRLGRKPAKVLFDGICLNNGIHHHSPPTTGKIERLHKTMRKEFFTDKSFATIDEM